MKLGTLSDHQGTHPRKARGLNGVPLKGALNGVPDKHWIIEVKYFSDGPECFRAFGETGYNHFAIVTGGGPEIFDIPPYNLALIL